MQKSINFLVLALMIIGASFWYGTTFEQEKEVFGSARNTSLPSRFDVLVWNIFKGGKKEQFLKEFKSYTEEKDLILLQEAMRGDTFVEKAFSFKKNFEFFMATSFYKKVKGAKIKTGVATGATVRPLSRQLERSPQLEAGVATPKVTAYTYYPLQGSTEALLVVNIHALNFVLINAFQEHITQAGNAIKTHQGPVIFAGDFNTNFPQGEKKEEFLMKYIKELGLTKTVFLQDARQHPNTECFKNEIDYIFVRGLTASNAYVPHASGSDHCPLIATLTLVP